MIFDLQMKYNFKIIESSYIILLKDYEKINWNIMHQYYFISRKWYELLLFIKQMNKQKIIRNKIKNILKIIKIRFQIEKKEKMMKILNEIKNVIENVRNTQEIIILKWDLNII